MRKAARASTHCPSESGIGNNQIVAPISRQITSYLASHAKFPASELVVLDGGGNDTYAQFSSVCWGTDDNGPGTGSGNTTIAGATSEIMTAAYAQVANIQRIHDNGAPVVLVAAASDWSGNPFGAHYLSDAYQAKGCYTKVPASQITAWTTQFNKILQGRHRGHVQRDLRGRRRRLRGRRGQSVEVRAGRMSTRPPARSAAQPSARPPRSTRRMPRRPTCGPTPSTRRRAGTRSSRMRR